MKKAYLDCSSGISGDMFLAVLIDAGVPVDRLFSELRKLSLGFYEFKRTRAVRGGLVGARVDIRVPGEQPHRKLADIQVLLEKALLPEKAAAMALKIFTTLAEVEGKLHNVPAAEIHFHEVGAVDAILDIVGTCVGMELLEISELICSPLNVGSGHVNAAHGSLPIPAPATAELLKNIPIYSSGVEGELVTPTGAALVAALASGFGPLPSMKIEKIGYGAGEKEFPGHPNVARLFVGELLEAVTGQPGLPGDEVVSVIEATIHEMSPQLYASFVERVMAAGALDVTRSAARMKNNQPGLALSILCEPVKSDELSQLVLDQSTAADIRIYEARRKVMAREKQELESPAGDEIVSVIEATVHDMSPQLYGSFLEQVMAAGALDVSCNTTRMKKNQPGLTLSILCAPEKSDELSQLLFAQTTTTGIRTYEARRKVMERDEAKLEPPAGDEIVSVIEATVNDMGPQLYGNFLEQAMAAGALDVTCSTARMKKNRPGLALSIVCEPEKSDELSQLLFAQTTAAGIRTYEARRKKLDREQAAVESPAGDEIVSVIEANIDDMSPQLYGYFMEQALAAGALDVTCSSAQMKKNRPGLTISILCEPDKSDALSQLLFEQTTTIGVRIYEARRKVLDREQVTVETPYGTVQVKVARREGKVVNAAPEFDDCQRLAMEKSVPLKQVIAAAEAAYLQPSEKVAGA
jgi:uncharacterized protein (TIGR00299 family) protein